MSCRWKNCHQEIVNSSTMSHQLYINAARNSSDVVKLLFVARLLFEPFAGIHVINAILKSRVIARGERQIDLISIIQESDHPILQILLSVKISLCTHDPSYRLIDGGACDETNVVLAEHPC